MCSLILGLVFLFPSGAIAAPGGRGEDVPARGIERVLFDFKGEDTVAPLDLLDSLLLAGPSAYPKLIALLANEPVTDVPALGGRDRARYSKALIGVPGQVKSRRSDPGISLRRLEVEARLAVRVLGDIGAATDLGVVLTHLGPSPRGETIDGRMLKVVDEAIVKLLSRDARSFSVLEQRFRALSDTNKAIVLHAVGGEASSAAMDFLVLQLEREKNLTSLILSQFGRVAARELESVTPQILFLVQGQLTSGDPIILREACLALGRLQSVEIVGELIALLEHGDRGVEQSALWALTKITRKNFPSQPSRWRRWWISEEAWWDAESLDVLPKLRSSESGVIGTALRELAGHRLHRDEITLEILPLLEHSSDTVIAQACATLEVLGSSRGSRALQALTERASDEVLPHAQLALASSRP